MDDYDFKVGETVNQHQFKQGVIPGTVVEVYNQPMVRVLWDNGALGDYRPDQLRHGE